MSDTPLDDDAPWPPHYAPWLEDPDPPNPHMSDEEIEAAASKAAEWARANPLASDED
jgi:hypothetical protein